MRNKQYPICYLCFKPSKYPIYAHWEQHLFGYTHPRYRCINTAHAECSVQNTR